MSNNKIRNMKSILKPYLAIACGALTLGTAHVNAVSFDISSVPGSAIAFDGASNFTFTPASPSINFEVDTGTAAGLFGSIGGTFTIGAVTTVGPTSSAPVTGSGTFEIFDGGDTLSAVIDWDEMSQTGTGSVLNVNGIVNLTSITYGGSNADLLDLFNDASGYAVVTFQFTPAKSLASMKSTASSTSFSGSITSTPDGGATAGLLGAALMGMAAVARRRK